jgi:DNA-directed RNA polymerase specialized sigma24 family protein
METALEAMPVEDRMLIKLRFWQEASIADAARILGVDQRPLYRRQEKLLAELRKRLASEGLSVEDVRGLVERSS